MNKEGLISLIKEVFELGTKVEAERKLAELDTLVEVIAERLETGSKVKLGRYIEIENKHVEAKTCRNPKTGESIEVPAKDVTKIKATKAINK